MRQYENQTKKGMRVLCAVKIVKLFEAHLGNIKKINKSM